MTYIRILIAVSGLALLTACGGGGVTITATDVAKLEAELRKAKAAQREAEISRDDALSSRETNETAMNNALTAQAEAERLREIAETAMNNALSAQLKANREIARLKNELATAIDERDSARGDKNVANLRIIALEGELATATSAKKFADAEVLQLTQELITVIRAKSIADAEVLRLTKELATVTGDKSTAESERDDANLRITELEGELLKANNAKKVADAAVLRLTGDKNTADAEVLRLTGAKNTADAEVLRLEEELKTVTEAKEAADAEVLRLTGAKNTADAEVLRLNGAKNDADAEVLRLTRAKNDADAEVLRLTGELADVTSDKDDADAEVLRLTGALSTADAEVLRLTSAKNTADAEVLRLTGALSTADAEVLRLTGELRTMTEAKESADAEVLRLTGAKNIADAEVLRLTGALSTADAEVLRLTGELRTVTEARESADAEVLRLTGALSDADADVLRLTGELADVTRDKNDADADVLRLTGELSDANADVERLTGELADVTGDKNTADAEVLRLTGAKNTADAEVLRLTGELADVTRDKNDADAEVLRLTGAKESADAEVLRLAGELRTMTEARESADADVLRLTGELADVTRDKNAADADVLRLTEELRIMTEAKESSDADVLRLTGELRTVTDARESADADVLRLTGELADVTRDKNDADAEVLRLTGALSTADTEVLRLTGELADVTSDKNDADAEVLRLTGALSTADAEVLRLAGELRTVTDAKNTADAEVLRLTGALSTADAEVLRLTGAKNTADAEVLRLTGELKTMTDAKESADAEVLRLTGELKTVTDAKNIADAEVLRLTGALSTADADVLRLTGELADVTRDKNAADAEVLRLTRDKNTADAEVLRLTGELADVTSDKNTADAAVLRLTGELKTVTEAKESADAEVLRLTGELKTMTDARESADADVLRLTEELRIMTEARESADADVLRLTGELADVTSDKNDADAEVLRLTGALSTADTEVLRLTGALADVTSDKNDADADVLRLTGELSDANADVERLTGELADVTGDKNDADAEVLRLTGELNDANADILRLTGELENANTEITRLDRFIRPTYANWKLAVNPETVPNVISPQNQFLQADEDSISTEGTTAVPNDVQTLNLLTATFDGLPLDGESADGVAFFQGQINGTNYNYAGIFSGTDLGAPITDRAGTKAIWYGSFNHTLNPSKDFALTVIFNKIGGTLDAFVRAGVANNHFIFDDVRFDTRGLITGEVLYISFSQNGRTAITRTQTATLRGLIGEAGEAGEAGAVGVFVGETGSNSNIAGGFVAHPTAKLDSNKINFADWGGVDGDSKTTVINKDNTDTDPLLYGVASVVNDGPAGNFIHGLATVDGKGFNFVGTPFASATVTGDVLYLDEDRTSGAAFSRVSGKYYAGLLPTTDLGVPIIAKNLSVIWDAQFTLNSKGGAFVNSNFKMRVTFNGNGGTINSGRYSGRSFEDWGVPLSSSPSSGTIEIRGKFGRDGVLYGTAGSGTLTGLIGVNGAVGAFVGATLAGGFVASPNAANTVNAADWGGTAGNPKTTVINKGDTGTDPLLNGFESVVNIGPEGNFIQGLPTVAGKGFNFAGTAFSDGTVYGDVLLLDEGSSSGVAFSHVLGTGVTGRKYYAGLLSSTNLGAPISNSNASAIWNAQFRAVLGGVSSDIREYSHLGFKMRITYNGSDHISTINSGTVSNGIFTKGSVTVPYTNLTPPRFNGSNDFSIQGKFGKDGLLYGTVNLGENTEATLTGLVGVNGAVGAFVGIGRGSHGVNIAGGFVAYPIATVNFADWAGFAGNMRTDVINKDNTGTEPLLNGAASVVNSGPRVNFIQRLTKSDGQGFNFAGTPFANATVFGDVLYLDEDRTSGSGVAFSQVSGTGVTGERYYAGLLSTTNLGSRITDPNTSAIWDARLMGVFKISTSSPQRYSSSHFKMQVIFDGNKGTISSGTVSGSSFTRGQIPTVGFGDFNITGKFGRDGLLYGTVDLVGAVDIESTLTGLIGFNGAVGAFVGGGGGVNIAGGFVAHPIGKVNFASWGGAKGEPKAIITAGINQIITSEAGTAPLLNGTASVGNANPTGNFIQGLDTLDGQGFDFAGTGFANASVTGGILYLDEDANSGSGVAFSQVRGTGVNRDKYYAGLLSDTALGLPITDPNTSAIWDARLMGVFKIFRPQRYSNLDFKMQVIFDGNRGTINSGTVSGDSFTPGKISTIGDFGDFNIEGRFDHDGLLYGTVGTTTLKGTLTGLIGQAGAVGAFAFTSNAVSYAGGFVATPPQ